MIARRLFFISARSLASHSTNANEVLISAVNGKRVITLNRPRALNALNLSMVRTMYPKYKKWSEDGDVCLVMMKGAGDKAFCAGGDVVAVTKSFKANDPAQTVHKDFFREEYLLNHQIGTCKMPHVALIDGITMGGGCGLSVHGKFRVATERTMLAMPETALGLFPDVGGSYFLPRLGHYLGQFIALTGYRLNGADVYHAGIATHFVPSSSLADLEQELVNLPKSEVCNERVDEVISKFKANAMPKFSLDPLLSEIESVFSASTVEEIIERLQKSETDFARKQNAVLAKMSPTSMKITLRQLQEGSRMEFAEVFTMEYRLTQNIMKGHDFHEGCRAILVEKDRKPVWKPAKLEDVTAEMLDGYFAPLPASDELIIH
uniref:3-hydroxyisobutyryl-CoA hydrolase, mitochondrial n=2 Tax=Ascaris TaxID=6251 RepID=F1KWG5_ASCSU